LNYRHEFHAGNFADLLKHAIVLAWIKRLGGAGGLTVLDTHAGSGLYDLKGEASRKSGEADQGVARLMADASPPPVMAALKRAVQAENGPGQLRFYPGSPAIVLKALRTGDTYIGCELHPDAYAALSKFARARGGDVRRMDGYTALAAEGWAGKGRRLVIIDPPFERGDEYPNIIKAVRADRSRDGEAAYAIWTPIKDLQTFDSFLGALEDVGISGLAVEARLRPLTDPMKMNGCAMVLLGSPAALAGIEAPAQQAADWVVQALGAEGALAKVERFG